MFPSLCYTLLGMSPDGDVSAVLTEAFRKVQETLLSVAESEANATNRRMDYGTTACLAMLRNRTLTVAVCLKRHKMFFFLLIIVVRQKFEFSCYH